MLFFDPSAIDDIDDSRKNPPISVVHVESGKNWRGAQVQVLLTIEGQRDRGHRAVLVCPPNSQLQSRASNSGIPVHSLNMRISHYPADTWRMTHLLRSLKPDVVHLHSSHAHNVGGLAARLAGVPAVVLSKRMDSPISSALDKVKYRVGYDRILAISNGVKQILLEAGVPSDRVAVVHDAVDAKWWQHQGDRDRVRQEFGFKEDDVVVAIVAEIEKRKGQSLLLQSMPIILRNAPNVKALFVGRGELKEEDRAFIRQHNLESRVFLAGFRDDVQDVVAASDIIAAPSYLEGLGVAILEGMACGKPIVASRIGGIPESVVDGYIGRLISPGNSQELTRAIVELSNDAELRHRFGANGRQKVSSEFSAQYLTDATLANYYELLKKRKTNARYASLLNQE